ncbi:MAG TPA: tetratricopeptide repeat protein [Flavisolibacter sp.]|nr:tetratricopeptide repeat protein [Flavisolibacter sp.]
MKHALIAILFLRFLLVGSLAIGQKKDAAHQYSSITAYEGAIKYYRYYKQDSAIFLTERALVFARRTGDSAGVAAILLQIGMINDNQGEFDSAQNLYQQALLLFQQAGSKKGVIAATIRLGVVEVRNDHYDNAVKYFLDALKMAEETGDKYGIMEANYSISWAWLDQKGYDKALHYLELAERMNQQLPFTNTSLNIYNHFGVAYRETGNYKKAKYYFNKGLERSDKPEYQGLNITLINNLATTYAKEGNLETAIALQERALGKARSIGNYLRELQTLSGLAKSYRKKDINQAINYLKEAVALSREKKSPRQEIRMLQMLSEYSKEKGDFKAALDAKEREHALSDTFFYKRVEKNITALKAEYELSKTTARLKELDLLNKKRNLELENAATIRIIFITGLSLLFIIICLLYNQYRIKQKHNHNITKKNLSLQRLVDEKELLLKEVHHRVKNNLQIIISLLETQSSFLTDKALAAMRDSQHRVYAMSLIHQKLYQTDDFATVSMTAYLPDLLSYLKESFESKDKIAIHSHIENIELDISQAIPLGLIINEAVTNAIKYAFPGDAVGDITIRLRCEEGNSVMLEISDNGIGLPTNWEKKINNSIGFKLMQGLSTDIQADFHIESHSGTRITIAFEAVQFTKELSKPFQPELQMALS